MTFRLSNKIIVVMLCFICLSSSANGQSLVELDETVDDISTVVGLLRGDISSLFPVSDFFTSSAKDDYRKKLKELTSIKFNRTTTEHSKWIKANKYTSKSLEEEKFWYKVNPTWNRKTTSSDVSFRHIDSFGAGKSKEKIDAYKSRQLKALNNLSIENVFPIEVKNRILDNLSVEEKNVLNIDIKHTPILINFFSKYPETITIYKKLITSDYRKDVRVLYFWTYDFLTEITGLQKKEIINPAAITFHETDTDRLEVMYGESLLATLSTKHVEIYDPVMLNYAFPPNYTVCFNNLTFRTDNLKRLTSIHVRITPKNEKREKIPKSKMYDIKKFNKTQRNQYAFLIPEKINGYKVLQNAFKINDKRYKLLLKYIEQSYSLAQKQGDFQSMEYDFYYDSGAYEPYCVEIGLQSPIETKKLTYGQKIRLDLMNY